LQLLLSGKASSSSLKGIDKSNISSPLTNNDSVTASDSSVSTPQSAVTAPQGMFTLPPVINSPLENSPLGMGNNLQITPPRTAPLEASTHYRDDEVENAKHTTPIADRYRTTSTSTSRSSLFSVALATRSVPEVPKTNHLRRTTPRRPTTSDASSTHLDLELGNEEDWTRSVLMAADIETAWPRER